MVNTKDVKIKDVDGSEITLTLDANYYAIFRMLEVINQKLSMKNG